MRRSLKRRKEPSTKRILTELIRGNCIIINRLGYLRYRSIMGVHRFNWLLPSNQVNGSIINNDTRYLGNIT